MLVAALIGYIVSEFSPEEAVVMGWQCTS